MQLKAFRVQEFRAVSDTGWQEIVPLSILIGKNESGKTTILRALECMDSGKGFSSSDLSLNVPFAKGHRTSPIVECRLQLTQAEAKQLSRSTDLDIATDLWVKKTYSGTYLFWIDESNEFEVGHQDIESLQDKLGSGIFAPEPLRQIKKLLSQYRMKYLSRYRFLSGGTGTQAIMRFLREYPYVGIKDVEDVEKSLKSPPNTERDYVDEIIGLIDSCKKYFDKEDAANELRIGSLFLTALPQFVFLDTYRIINERYTRDELQELDNDDPIKHLLDMAGIDEETIFDESESVRAQIEFQSKVHVSGRLTEDWQQRVIEPVFRFSSDELNILVGAPGATPVPLESRSEGFRWFLSFYSYFQHDKGENTVYLLDDPGVSLHAEGQRDAYRLFEKLVSERGVSILYSTHSAFMVDSANFQRVLIMEYDEGVKGSIHVRGAYTGKGEDPLEPLKAAIFASTGMLVLDSERLLVTEGSTDYFYWSLFLKIARRSRVGGAKNICVVPGRSSGKVPVWVALYASQGLNVLGLLDGDDGGESLVGKMAKDDHPCKDLLVTMPMLDMGVEPEQMIDPVFYAEGFCRFYEIMGEAKTNVVDLFRASRENGQLDLRITAKKYLKESEGIKRAWSGEGVARELLVLADELDVNYQFDDEFKKVVVAGVKRLIEKFDAAKKIVA